MTQPMQIRRALISVFDKTEIIEFARGLADLGIEILASGGTADALRAQAIPMVAVEDFTGAKEVLGGRVKTLHPRIHAGILADRRVPEHGADLLANGYKTIDLVVCNLYPFESYLKQGKSRDELIEKIDIGGPTLLRAAAKNVDGGCTVIIDPMDYSKVLTLLSHNKTIPVVERRRLAAKAFRAVARYDLAIAAWTEKEAQDPELAPPPQDLQVGSFSLVQPLRYGENPHQQAWLYTADHESSGVARGHLLAGKELSYNNLLDMDAAYRAVYGLTGNHIGCSIVKHTNPCGMAIATSQESAFKQALAGDPVSAFGGIIGFNTAVELATVQAIKEAKLFVECIVAPGFTPEAQAELMRRENLRLFVVPSGNPAPMFHSHRIGGGLLVEDCDIGVSDPSTWQVVTSHQVHDSWWQELRFAMHAAAVLKSNAIAITRDMALRGAGAGQMSRVDATEQAIKKAGEFTRGAFMASDAFFPFSDCVELAARAGIVAIIQPGGSKRDQDSVAACDQHGIAMVFTGRRHFRH